MTLKSMDAANRVLLRSSIDFIKNNRATGIYLPLRPCKKERWADNSGEHYILVYCHSKLL